MCCRSLARFILAQAGLFWLALPKQFSLGHKMSRKIQIGRDIHTFAASPSQTARLSAKLKWTMRCSNRDFRTVTPSTVARSRFVSPLNILDNGMFGPRFSHGYAFQMLQCVFGPRFAHGYAFSRWPSRALCCPFRAFARRIYFYRYNLRSSSSNIYFAWAK